MITTSVDIRFNELVKDYSQFQIGNAITKHDNKIIYIVNGLSCPFKYSNKLLALRNNFKKEFTNNLKLLPNSELRIKYINKIISELEVTKQSLNTEKQKSLELFEYTTTLKQYFDERDLEDVKFDNEEYEMYGEFDDFYDYYRLSEDYQKEKLCVFFQWHLTYLEYIFEICRKNHYDILKITKEIDTTLKQKKRNYFSFVLKKEFSHPKTKIALLRSNLISGEYIPKGTTYNSFEKLFSGKPVENKIRWEGSDRELKAFVQELKKYLDLTNSSLDVYKIALNCFSNNQGLKFKSQEQLTKAKPTETQKDALESIIKNALNAKEKPSLKKNE